MLRLEVRQVFPNPHRMSPYRRFPFKGVSRQMPGTGLPLSPYRKAHIAMLFSKLSRGFPQQDGPLPSLFCNNGFTSCQLHRARSNWPHPAGSTATTQGRLHCTQLITTCRFIPQAIVIAHVNSHALGSPRKRGQRPHALVGRPTSLTPSTSSQLGVSSQHQELHRCALNGFLGPSSKEVS